MTTVVYEGWMDYTEYQKTPPFKMVPKEGAPSWVVDKIDEFYRYVDSTYPQEMDEEGMV